MEKDNFPTTLSLALILSILLAFSGHSAADNDYGIAVYWGRNNAEGTLRDACASGLYKYVNVAYLVISGVGSSRDLDLADHCSDSYITCPLIAFDVLYCKNKGIKVLLSLSGGVSDGASKKSAKDLAKYIWNSYLGGWALVRPLGQFSLDGVDFAFATGPSDYYQELAAALKTYSTKSTKVYISASPKCQTSGNNLSPAIAAGMFDYVWVQFYNDESCDISAGYGAFAVTWNNWYYDVVPSGTMLFAGLPASKTAAKSGYMPAEDLANLLPYMKGDKFGGVMVWNRYYDKSFSKTVLNAFSGGLKPNSAAGSLSQVVSV